MLFQGWIFISLSNNHQNRIVLFEYRQNCVVYIYISCSRSHSLSHVCLWFDYLQLSVEMLRNLSPPPFFVVFLLLLPLWPPPVLLSSPSASLWISLCYPLVYLTLPLSSFFFFAPSFLLSSVLPFVVLPPCLVVWWPGTGTVQGILSDTTMRERCGTCCNSSSLGSPRNSTTSR